MIKRAHRLHKSYHINYNVFTVTNKILKSEYLKAGKQLFMLKKISPDYITAQYSVDPSYKYSIPIDQQLAGWYTGV